MVEEQPMRQVYHMRLVTDAVDGEQLTGSVAIDVVLRGTMPTAMEAVTRKIHAFLEYDGGFSGEWAGIGRGEFVDEVKLR